MTDITNGIANRKSFASKFTMPHILQFDTFESDYLIKARCYVLAIFISFALLRQHISL